MRFLQQLSKLYYNEAKKLVYTWKELLRKATRETVINKVIENKFKKSIDKAKRDTLKQTIRDHALLKQKEEEIKTFEYQRKLDEINKEHKRVMKQPTQKTKIEEVAVALKGFTKSFEIDIKNYKDPLIQLQDTRKAIKHHIVSMLTSMKGLKFVETLKVTFKKMTKDGTLDKTAYFNSKPQTIINNTEIPEALQLTKQQILNFVAKWISEGSGWTIESVDNHYLNIVEYQPMKGSSYIQLPQELKNPKKGLINMKN